MLTSQLLQYCFLFYRSSGEVIWLKFCLISSDDGRKVGISGNQHRPRYHNLSMHNNYINSAFALLVDVRLQAYASELFIKKMQGQVLRKECMFAFPRPLLPGMYDTEPLKKKKNTGSSSFVPSQQVWKQKKTEERVGKG